MQADKGVRETKADEAAEVVGTFSPDLVRWKIVVGEASQSLVAWLNSPRHDKRREVVRRLLEGLKTNQWTPSLRADWRNFARLAERHRYQRTFDIFPTQTGKKTFLYPMFGMRPIAEGSWRERWLIDQMVILCDRGLLGRVIRCHWCRKWFYGQRDDQKFCKRECKVASEHDSPEYKAYQRRKQAELYQRRKLRLVKRRKGLGLGLGRASVVS